MKKRKVHKKNIIKKCVAMVLMLAFITGSIPIGPAVAEEENKSSKPVGGFQVGEIDMSDMEMEILPETEDEVVISDKYEEIGRIPGYEQEEPTVSVEQTQEAVILNEEKISVSTEEIILKKYDGELQFVDGKLMYFMKFGMTFITNKELVDRMSENRNISIEEYKIYAVDTKNLNILTEEELENALSDGLAEKILIKKDTVTLNRDEESLISFPIEKTGCYVVELPVSSVETQTLYYIINKRENNISFKDASTELEMDVRYKDLICISDLLSEESDNIFNDFEVTIEEGTDKQVTELIYDEINKEHFIRIKGVKKDSEDSISVKIKAKENEFTMESNTIELKLSTKKFNPQLKVTAAGKVKAYNQFKLGIELEGEGKDIIQQLIADKKAYFGITITHAQKTASVVEIDDIMAKRGTDGKYILPVTGEYFKNMSDLSNYIITATLNYRGNEDIGDYSPFNIISEKIQLSVEGDRIAVYTVIEGDGKYDYRSYYDKNVKLAVSMEKVEALDEGQVVDYVVTVKDASVVQVNNTDKYNSRNAFIPVRITGVGETDICVNAALSDNKAYAFGDASSHVRVSDSEFNYNDIVIEYKALDGDGSVVSFVTDEGSVCIDKWNQYLVQNNNWLSGDVCIRLSETGKKYYDTLVLDNGETGEGFIFDKSEPYQEYELSMLNKRTNADTNKAQKGKVSFSVGIDKETPRLKEFSYNENYFIPTKTDNCYYYADEFKLAGSFEDNFSGISKIEYTTEYGMSENTQWKECVLSKTSTSGEVSFEIVLGNGDYKAVAVRACDIAGNVSDTVFVKNDKGEFINIIVDNTKPQVSVEAFAGDSLYASEDTEQWTNKPISFDIRCDKGEAGIAGIYQCEYAFQSAGDSANHIQEYEWKVINEHPEKGMLLEINENKNGYYLFRAVSRSGVKSVIPVRKRVLLQQTLSDKKQVVVKGVDGDYTGEWYNCESGVPKIYFEYPLYDDGNASGEYDAPVTIHYNLSVQNEAGEIIELANNKMATKGVTSIESFYNGKFIAEENDLDSFSIDFNIDETTGYAMDGIYTLEYWISDAALNVSEKEELQYKIDCQKPTELIVRLADMDMQVDSDETVVYEKFYSDTISASASAKYGISGKGSIKILKAKKIGDWNSSDSFETGESFEITPCSRCFIYVVAEDGAGNKTEGWTNGIVVDNVMPTGIDLPELILEPEGANEHGFYNKDIQIAISVNDAPVNDNCAALMSVTECVGADGADTITDKQLFGFIKELPTYDELVGAQSFDTVQVIDAKANESNNAYIEVTATDRSLNRKTSTQVLKIDVTAPQIDITFDANDAVNGKYFNTNRTATIHIKELNFAPEYVKVQLTRDGEAVVLPVSEWTNNETDHYATVTFTEDGDYTMSVDCTDLADNEAETVSIEEFTIDKTSAKVTIELLGDAKNGFYYNSDVTANITVTEHNFDEKEFSLFLTGEQGTIKTAEWTHESDIHTTHAVFSGDSVYGLMYNCADMAGNNVEATNSTDFIIDTKLPVITISGIKNGSANAGEVIPVITVTDENFRQEGGIITVTTGKGRVVNVNSVVKAVDSVEGEQLIPNGFVYTLTDMTAQADDIYYMEMCAADMAGNEETLTYRFSINRNGSTYDVESIRALSEKYYNSYRALTEDLVIYEMNVDKIEDFNMYISRNGIMLTEKQVDRKPAKADFSGKNEFLYNVDISGDENVGYTYKYTLYKENFEKDGTYRMGLYSRDRAGNEVNSTMNANSEDISFVIDDTQPKVVIDGIESGRIYNTGGQTVNVMVTDNFKLNNAEFVLINAEGKELKTWDYNELVKNQGDIATITIPECDEEVSFVFRVSDAAGNELVSLPASKVAQSDLMVTAEPLMQMVNNPSMSIAGIIILVAGGLIIMIAITDLLLIIKKKRSN